MPLRRTTSETVRRMGGGGWSGTTSLSLNRHIKIQVTKQRLGPCAPHPPGRAGLQELCAHLNKIQQWRILVERQATGPQSPLPVPSAAARSEPADGPMQVSATMGHSRYVPTSPSVWRPSHYRSIERLQVTRHSAQVGSRRACDASSKLGPGPQQLY